MAETITIMVNKVDQMGAEIICEQKPRGCPGLGGWKRESGRWMTRIKGVEAAKFRGMVGQFVELTMDGDRIVSLS